MKTRGPKSHKWTNLISKETYVCEVCRVVVPWQTVMDMSSVEYKRFLKENCKGKTK